MSSAVDANVLVHASDLGSPRQPRAAELLGRLAAGPELLYLFWPVAVAYLRISTHARLFARPLSPSQARANVASLLAQAHVRTVGEEERFWPVLDRTLADGDARGNLVSDAHLVALMHQHGVRTIWTADRDFLRFPGITPRDPFT
jgi:toxin-antitoxin system PIN domain toxin